MTRQTRTSLLAAIVIAAAVSVLFGAPEVLTWLVMFVVPFGVIFGVLSVFLRLRPVIAWSRFKQGMFAWTLAAFIGLCVGILPRALSVFTS